MAASVQNPAIWIFSPVLPTANRPVITPTVFLDLADAIEKLFQCPVDLVTEQSVRNPYFRRVVETSRQLIYERPDTQTVV